MTKGNIKRHLLYFSGPLILGNLFQLTYNTVDSIIVGRYAGEEALAAVGSSNPIMSIAILGIHGICIGASVLIGEYFGAKKYDKLKRAVSTMFLFGLFFSLAFALLGFIGAKSLLIILGVPKAILNDAAVYLRIIFLGIPFTYAYNALAAAMRSIGDSATPVKFLAAASIINAGLDYILIRWLGMGVLGTALGTITAEGLSSLFCVYFVYKKMPVLQLRRQDLCMDRHMLKKTLQYGSITALQQSCQPIGKLLIQGVVNSLGVSAIAAFNAVCRVDDFAFTPEQSISHGMMGFIAQNRGAGKKERVIQGLKQGLWIEVCYGLLIGVLVFTFREPIMKLFVSKSETGMIVLGARYLVLMSMFYILPAITNGLQGYFRGMGDMKVTLLSTLIQISFRVGFVFLLVPRFGISAVAYASFIGWILMLIFEVPYYFIRRKSNV